MELTADKIDAKLSKFEQQTADANIARLSAEATFQRIKQHNPHQRSEGWPAKKRDAQAAAEQAQAKWAKLSASVASLQKAKRHLADLDELDELVRKRFGDDAPTEADLMADLRALTSDIGIAGDLFRTIESAESRAKNEADQMTRHLAQVGSPVSTQEAPDRAGVTRDRMRLSHSLEQVRRERNVLESRYSAKLEELRMIRERGQIEQERAQIQRELDSALRSNRKWEVFK